MACEDLEIYTDDKELLRVDSVNELILIFQESVNRWQQKFWNC